MILYIYKLRPVIKLNIKNYIYTYNISIFIIKYYKINIKNYILKILKILKIIYTYKYIYNKISRTLQI